ncbi:amidase [Virgibacillus sp. MSJ-26]|uniref:amidase n=1 Tax=Virgibacillus sp. MSJ-26 TaxID=2841522 RepID=UPI0020A0C43C|nr:amidase [Virgibacillus sp. MSJ-26]
MTKTISIKRQNILDMDASTLASKIKNGDLTSLKAVNTYINHIKEVNPSINAVVENHFSQAIEQAKVYDQKAKDGQIIGPLHGVPVSIKESFDVIEMKTTGGLIHRQDFIAKTDAICVAKLKKAGAIVLVKTNTPTLCFCQETNNKLYGRTNNPWDLSRTAGGSSGGEGALLGVGGIAIGLGSDIGGSIRFPSHFNGIVGFKPGKYQVSQKGHYPFLAHPLQERMQSIGPMGKSVQDIELLYSLIQEQPNHTNNKVKNLEIIFTPLIVDYPLSYATQNMYQDVKDNLASDFSVQEDIPPYLKESALLWQEIMSFDGGKSIREQGFQSDRPNVLKEYIKEKTTKNSQYHYYFTWALIGAALFKPSKKRQQEIQETVTKGDREIDLYLKDRLLILPVYHQGAPLHDSVYNEIFSIRKTFQQYLPFVAYANVWGLPSLTLPIGEDENNMPIAIQIISSTENEGALFEVGKWLEKKFGGYTRCDKLDNNLSV